MSTHDHTISSAESAGARLLVSIKGDLETEKIRLNTEIGSYPSPIPACDAQFNHLLEKRTRLATKLTLVDQLLAICHSDSGDGPGFEKFIADIRNIDPDMAEKIRAAFTIDSAH